MSEESTTPSYAVWSPVLGPRMHVLMPARHDTYGIDATNVARIKDRFLPAVRYVDHEP
jgi:hypothetical protein